MKKNFFGQPKEIIFCKKCVESNQRFVSSVQHKILKNQVKDTALFDNQGVCYSCKFGIILKIFYIFGSTITH